MRLTQQQKMTAVIFGILSLLALGAMTFINSTSDENGKIMLPSISTSTLPADASSNGWWDSIPTDPVLPSMPGFNTPTFTPTSNP